jgi:hypothetical protein
MGSSSFDAPAPIIGRLDDIDLDLASRQLEYEKAAGERARLVRDWDKRLAIHSRTANGPNAEVRKATALVAAIEQDDLYERLTDAESVFDAMRTAVRVMETRVGIAQSILKAQGRA